MVTADRALFESHQDIIPLEAIEGRRFTIVGCGSLGTLLGRILARLGGVKFHLIDGEKVELRHLNREVFAHGQIGDSKAAALAKQLQEIHPKVRSVTTAKTFDAGQLNVGKEDIVILASSDIELPSRVLESIRGWPGVEPRPAVFVTRHSGLVGGYWHADLAREPDAKIPKNIRWLVPTGVDKPDARSRIATTAHVVSGITGQAIVEHIMGRPVEPLVTVDLTMMLHRSLTGKI